MFIHLSLHESTTVIGMPSPEMKKKFTLCCQIVNSLNGWYPWIRLDVECESMVEKGINFVLCLGTAYDISSMESVGNYLVIFVDGKVCLSNSLSLKL
mgnify:CR=1 FL=1